MTLVGRFRARSAADRKQFRCVTIVDDFTRECIAIEADFCFRANGSEFSSCKMLLWSAESGVDWHFIEPGKPNQNASVESFNGRLTR